MTETNPKDQWLVRDAKNFVWGPVSRSEILELIRGRKLKPRTEIAASLSYWFAIEESREVVKFFPEVAAMYGEQGEQEATKLTQLTTTKTVPGEWLNSEYAEEFGYLIKESPEGTTVAKVKLPPSDFSDADNTDEPTLVPTIERGTDPTIPVETEIRNYNAQQSRKKFLVFSAIIVAILSLIFGLTLIEKRLSMKRKLGDQRLQLAGGPAGESADNSGLMELRVSLLLSDLTKAQEHLTVLERRMDSSKNTADALRVNTIASIAKAIIRKEFLVDVAGAILSLNELRTTGSRDARMMIEVDNLLAIYQLDSQPEESLRLMKQATTALPEDSTLRFNLGTSLLAAGQPGKAQEEFLALLQKLEAGDRLSPRINIALARADDKNAEEYLMKALALDPYLSEAQIMVALVHWRAGRRVKAEAFIRRFIDSLPSFREGLYVRNFRLAESELVYNSLRTEVRTLLSRVEQPDDLLLSLDGILSVLVGEYRAAEQAFERALQVAPGSIFSLKGMAFLRLREGREIEIEGLVKSKVEANRDSFALNMLMGQSYQKQGKLDEAFKFYNSLIAADPKLSLGHSHTGEILRQREKAELALQSFQKALEQNPYDITALRGLSLLGRGDRVNALLLQSLIPF